MIRGTHSLIALVAWQTSTIVRWLLMIILWVGDLRNAVIATHKYFTAVGVKHKISTRNALHLIN